MAAKATRMAKNLMSMNSDAITVAKSPRPTAVATGKFLPALP
jgi:hypothetical protein